MMLMNMILITQWSETEHVLNEERINRPTNSLLLTHTRQKKKIALLNASAPTVWTNLRYQIQ